jgi:DNA-binding GntR family transcriptional regulator
MLGTTQQQARRVRPADIVDAVRADIFSAELKPGDAIPELGIAKRFGVSQTTVREALARLEHAGLVRRVANRGTFVTSLSPAEFREHLRLRALLEALAASEAAVRATPESLEPLEQQLYAIAAAVEANDYFASAQADLEFHRAIWKLAGDGTLYRVLDQLTVPLFAFTSMQRSGSHEDLRRVVRSHQPIHEALRAGDATLAADTVREHIEKSYLQFLGRSE